MPNYCVKYRQIGHIIPKSLLNIIILKFEIFCSILYSVFTFFMPCIDQIRVFFIQLDII